MPDLDLEQFHVQRFLQTLALYPDEPPLRCENPDFLLQLNGHRVGLEHTQFFLPPRPGAHPQQKLDSLRDRAVEKARRRFRDAGGPALYVYPEFNEPGPRTNREADNLARRLAEIVLANGWPSDVSHGHVTHEIWKTLSTIHSYTVMASVDGTDELWSAGGGGFVETVTKDQVQNCLNRKAPKYPVYSSEVSEVWLLIVYDMIRGGVPCEISEAARHARYSHPFDRAFWYEVHDGDVVEILNTLVE